MQNDGSEIILCPVDFSELSGYALRYAVEIAQCRQAPVIALHTSWWEVPAYFTTARIAELQRELRGAQRAAARGLREFIESTLGNAADEVASRVVESTPAEGILRITAETQAGLIVMGTHGRHGWNRWTLGSVAERVLRESLVPVLTVRNAPPLPIRRILCPVSDTTESQHALEIAVRMGACFDSMVTALHVREPHPTAVIANLCAWIRAEQRSRCQVQELVRDGNAAEEIIRLAGEDYDLLVIGAARHRFFDGMVLGSTTVRAVRHAPCPVLTVGAPSAQLS